MLSILTVTVLVGFLYMVSGLIAPIVLGGFFASLLYPTHKYLVSKKKYSNIWSAIGLTLTLTLLFIVPVLVVVLMGSKAILQKLPLLTGIQNGLTNGPSIESFPFIQRALQFLNTWFGIDRVEVTSFLSEGAQNLGTLLAENLAKFLASVPNALIALTVLVISVLFFLLDGKEIRGHIQKLKVLPPKTTNRFIDLFPIVSRALLLASLTIGIVQATIFGFTSLFLGLDNALLIGFLVFVTSFIPVIGSAPITFGVVLFELLVISSPLKGLTLLGAAVLCSMSDNIIRTMAMKGEADLHPLITFVAVLGGVSTFGVYGIFLGPVIACYVMLTIKAYQESVN